MTNDPLLELVVDSHMVPAQCRRCEGTAFKTQYGVGQVYWWGGIGAVVQFGLGMPRQIVNEPVTCASCGARHSSQAAPPTPPSRLLGGG